LRRAALSENVLPEELGAKLFAVKGCNACHSLDGSRIIGPSFKGSWGTERQLESGETVVMDENYVKESVLTPAVKIVKGFPNAMTPYEGQLSDKEIDGLIAYLKTLK
jgi:cytochrome c oxidase subunit 2